MKIRYYKRLEFWAALALIVVFFLPWASIRGNSPVNGLQLADTMRQSSSITSAFISPPSSYGAFNSNAPAPVPDTTLMAFTAFLIYVIPIGAMITVLLDPVTHNSRPGIVYFLISVLPFVVLLIMLDKIGTDIFKSMTFGAYLTLAAAALCSIGLLSSHRAPNKPRPA